MRLTGALVALVLSGCAWATPAPEEPTAPETPIELPARVRAEVAANVRLEPSTKAARRGVLLPDAVLAVDAWQEGPGCKDGWFGLEGRGWVCAKLVEPTEEPVTGPPAMNGDLPFIYARRRGGNAGRIFTDEAAVAAGKAVGALEWGRAYHFTKRLESEAGTLLVLPSGRVVPESDVSLYTPSEFVGTEIAGETLPAWTRAETTLHAEPAEGEGTALAARALVWLGETQDVDGVTWQATTDPVGWVRADALRTIRLLDPLETGETTWIDLDLDKQVLTLRGPDGPTYATLVSTGTGGADRFTPLGVFAIGDKMLHWDMASTPDSSDRYHVEEVPFVMHFWPRFALHTAFWHDGFGGVRSHGCVNLPPGDSRPIFDAIAPVLPDGWHTVYATAEEPGTPLRIHRGSADVPERRAAGS